MEYKVRICEASSLESVINSMCTAGFKLVTISAYTGTQVISVFVH